MIKGWRLLATSLAVLAVGGFLWIKRPNACDDSVTGEFEISAWLGRLVDGTLSDGIDHCDPWDRIEADAPLEPILIHASINAYAGPATTEIYIEPSGKGFVAPLELGELLSPDEMFAKITNEVDGGFTFHDRSIYREVAGLIRPLHGYTLPGPIHRLMTKMPKKQLIACGPDGYHQGYTVFWKGNYDEPINVSYFSTGSGGRNCPALSRAMGRLGTAIEIARGAYPKEWNEEWAKQLDEEKAAHR
jgi:hypothetical protein